MTFPTHDQNTLGMTTDIPKHWPSERRTEYLAYAKKQLFAKLAETLESKKIYTVRLKETTLPPIPYSLHHDAPYDAMNERIQCALEIREVQTVPWRVSEIPPLPELQYHYLSNRKFVAVVLDELKQRVGAKVNRLRQKLILYRMQHGRR